MLISSRLRSIFLCTDSPTFMSLFLIIPTLSLFFSPYPSCFSFHTLLLFLPRCLPHSLTFFLPFLLLSLLPLSQTLPLCFSLSTAFSLVLSSSLTSFLSCFLFQKLYPFVSVYTYHILFRSFFSFLLFDTLFPFLYLSLSVCLFIVSIDLINRHFIKTTNICYLHSRHSKCLLNIYVKIFIHSNYSDLQ